MFKAVFLMLTLAGCCDADDWACQDRQAASAAEQNAILGGIIAGGGYRPYRPAPTFVTCAPGAQGTVSCIGQ
jgi:hypothetical protein